MSKRTVSLLPTLRKCKIEFGHNKFAFKLPDLNYLAKVYFVSLGWNLEGSGWLSVHVILWCELPRSSIVTPSYQGSPVKIQPICIINKDVSQRTGKYYLLLLSLTQLVSKSPKFLPILLRPMKVLIFGSNHHGINLWKFWNSIKPSQHQFSVQNQAPNSLYGPLSF